MPRFRVTLTMTPPTTLDKLWYRRINEPPPLASASTGPRHHKLARLAPYRWRRFHRAYATACGFFWLPCPLCGRKYGGHEAGKSVPDPVSPPLYIAICSPCSYARVADADD